MAASRLHRQVEQKALIELRGGNVDVFGAIHALDLPLLLRPLDGLLGAFIRDPVPGVLITTLRPMPIQRFTAAHELGHYYLQHQPSLDDETILRRMAATSAPAADYQEIEADAFAIGFMMPLWLIVWHCERQGWTAENLAKPGTAYQLALRLGASYKATCLTLGRHNLLPFQRVQDLLKTEPKQVKSALLVSYQPRDYRGDVWLLTERDANTRIDGSRNDLFVLRLAEHSGGGYLWNIDQLRASGFAVVGDAIEDIDGEGVGGPVMRRVTAANLEAGRGTIQLDERRPWDPDEPLARLAVDYDFTGPEEIGLSRAERRILLEAA
nr:ImmA/IrrE family metallo-endopeptidase [Sphingomonas sp. CARO-RG-8B-R24-01]